MAVSYTNNWKNIADKLKNILSREFGRTLPVYIGEGNYSDNQFMKIIPTSNELKERVVSAELRQYNFNLIIYIMEGNASLVALNNTLRILSKVESVIGNNQTMTLTDSTTSINGELSSYEIEGSELYRYIITMDYMCHHLGCIS